MNIVDFHHIAIICSNYSISKDFYTNILGFEVKNEVYREERKSYKLDLIRGSMNIELFSFTNVAKRPSYPEAAGLRHLAFKTKDILKDHKYLISRGVKVEDLRIDEFTGKKFFFFFDPDNLPLEIYE
ncbi:VOC family protein [Clostridium sp.]|uniref:SMU1112c/YaeR family gloxylase I-like metalloprotein n=1 Tax=Clostridium sp. TaxID=1506 RepID=UPI003463D9F9